MRNRLNLQRWSAISGLLSIIISWTGGIATAANVTAKKADNFIDSMGINIKLDRTEYDTNWSKVKPRFQELGLWHYRDNLKNVNNSSTYRNRYQSLYNEGGAIGLFIWGPWENQNKPGNQAVGAAKKGPDYVVYISGPNEPDLFWPNDYDNNPNTNLWAEARNYQNQMYNALKADSATDDIIVTTPPVSNYVLADDLGNVNSDIMAWHWYTGQGQPDKNEVGTGITQTKIGLGNSSAPNSDLFTTESGHNSWKTANPGNSNTVAVNEVTQMHYNLRILADQFRRGIGRTYMHQLMDLGTNANDFNHSWGIVKANSNKTPKPFFTAWKNLINLFKERTWNSSSKTWNIPSFSAGSLNYSITGNTDAVKNLLLQKSDGDFYMLVWVAADSWNESNDTSRVVNRNIDIVFNNAQTVTRQTFNNSGGLINSGISSSNGSKTWSFTASTVLSILKIEGGGPVTNVWYKIRNQGHGGNRNLRGGESGINWNVTTATNTGWAAQWKLVNASSNYFYLRNRGNGGNRNLRADNADNNWNVHTNTNTGDWVQWRLIDVGGGFYNIRNKGHSGNRNLRAGNGAENWNVNTTTASQQWEKWRFVP
ncbi:MAG: hypothetical protein AAF558_11595 [Verrucomicrobiota bacterium]